MRCYTICSPDFLEEPNLANGRPWSPDDSAELRRLAGSGMTDDQIGERMGRNAKLVCRKRRALGIEPGVKPAMSAMMARINLRRLQRRFEDR